MAEEMADKELKLPEKEEAKEAKEAPKAAAKTTKKAKTKKAKAAPKAAEQAPEPPKPAAPALPKVALAVYLQTCGKKWDKMAGFKYHARREGLQSLTLPEWKAAYDEFMKKPVG